MAPARNSLSVIIFLSVILIMAGFAGAQSDDTAPPSLVTGLVAAGPPSDCIPCIYCRRFERWKTVCTLISQFCIMHNYPSSFCEGQKQLCEKKVDDLIAKCHKISCEDSCTEKPQACEFLVYDGERQFNSNDHGFHKYYKEGGPIPATWPADWTKPVDYWNGVWQVRIEVKNRPPGTDSKLFSLQPCIWMHDADGPPTSTPDQLESCDGSIYISTPKVYEHTTEPIADWWHKNNGANKVDLSRPHHYQYLGLVMRGYFPSQNPNFCYVSDYNIPNNPLCWDKRADYLPLDFRLTIVAVPKGGTFSGWSNYIGSTSSSQSSFTHTIIDSNGPADSWGKGVGDINKDSKIDLLVGGISGLYWYENPSWTKHTIDTSEPHFSTDIEVADINKDSKNDVLTVTWSSASGKVLLYLNTGTGWTAHTIANDKVHDIELADFDNDGDLDIVARNQASTGNILYFYRQDSPTSWSRSTLTLTHAGEGIKVADINNDVKPDIVVTRQWYENTGGISGWIEHTYSSAVYTRGYIEAGDLNADGRKDILISPSEPGGSGTPRIIWFEAPANPANSWTEHIIENNVEPMYHFVGIGDFNKDSKPDVATAMMQQATSPKVKIYYNTDGKGTFSSPQIVADMSSHSIKVVDVDNDGDPDLYGADHSGNPTQINLWKTQPPSGGAPPSSPCGSSGTVSAPIFNPQSGTYASPQTVTISTSTSGAIIRYTLDGTDPAESSPQYNAPITISSTTTIKAKAFKSVMTPSSVASATYITPLGGWTYIQVDSTRSECAFGLAFGDLDKDGRKDIVSGRAWYRNPGGDLAGTWSRTVFPWDLDAMLVLDVDSDSYADLIAEGPESGNTVPVYWLEAANADATSWTQTQIGEIPADPVDGKSQGYALGELSGGGRPEIALSSKGIHYFQIPANPEAGNWPRVQVNADAREEGIALGDIDRDNDLDVIGILGPAGTTISWWENPGWTRHDLGMTSGVVADRIAVADINGDTKLDVIATETNLISSGNSAFWYEQPGDPASSSWPRHTIASNYGSLNSMDVGNLNSDSLVDVVVGEHRGSLKIMIFENIASGSSWTSSMVSQGKESHLGTRLVDLDNDGDLEIVSIACDAKQYLHLWRHD